MAAFNLLPTTWTQIIAPGGAKDQQVQITAGRALVLFGAPDANSSPIVGSTNENKFFVVPAGVEFNARSSGPSAAITTGDY